MITMTQDIFLLYSYAQLQKFVNTENRIFRHRNAFKIRVNKCHYSQQ